MADNFLTVIEVTDTHVKRLSARAAKAGGVLTTCDVRPLQAHTDDEIVTLLRAMKGLSGKQAGRISVILPRRFVIIKTLRLPTQDEQEVRQMAALQIPQQIPYSIDDVLLETQILRRDTNGYALANIFVVHKEVAERFYRLMEKSGIAAEDMVLSSYAFAGFAGTSGACLEIDTAQTEIAFFSDRKLIYSRVIPYGFRDLNGEFMPELVHQIVVSFKSFRKDHPNENISALRVLSRAPETDSLKNELQKALNITVEGVDVLSGFQMPKSGDMSALQGVKGVSMGCCLGAVRDARIAQPRFVPSRVTARRQDKVKQGQWLRLVTSMAVLLLLIGGVFFIRYQEKNNRLQFVKQKNTELRAGVAEARKQMDLVNFFDKELKERIIVAELIDEIVRLLPPDVSLRSIQLDADGGLSLQGYAQVGTGINTLQENMVKSPFFTGVNLQFATKRRIFNQDLTDFKITSGVSVRP